MPLKNRLGFALAVLMGLSLVACAGLEQRPASVKAEAIKMAAPIGPARRIVQQLTATWQGRQNSLLVVLELNSKAIAMAGVSNEGLSLFNLKYDGAGLQADKNPLLPENLRPEFVIRDLQWIYWPVAAIQPILPAGWSLQSRQNGRWFYDHDKPQVQITYLSTEPQWPLAVELLNLVHNYRLTIKTLSYEPLSE